MSSQADTEGTLRDWRYGQTQAERLVAGLLYIEGFKKIDPQLPLGGPDGKKDILFSSEGRKWLAAVYFPPTDVTFADTEEKFRQDCKGVTLNGVDGIAFFVNKRLSPTERKKLIEIASPTEAEIYHLERIRALLDSPKGCGLRLEYLRIPMNEAEQWAFWQAMNSSVMDRLVESDEHIRRLHEKVDLLLKRTESAEFGFMDPQSSINKPLPRLDGLGTVANLSVGMLLWAHRLVTDRTGLPESVRGKIRSIQVWITGAGQSIADQKYVPPPPDQIQPRLEALLENWRSLYPSLVNADRDRILLELARFHHAFLSLHPFTDANGRVARAIIDQAAHELLGMQIGPEIGEKSGDYYAALEKADGGDLVPLTRILKASLSR